ncbi:hypothetical protein [Serinicoccus sp. CNJ-927]|nr:hypothetical protein [Serinicoccus sp. CNJ-927]
MLARLRGRQDVNLWFWVFVGPFFAGLVLFIYVPIGGASTSPSSRPTTR